MYVPLGILQNDDVDDDDFDNEDDDYDDDHQNTSTCKLLSLGKFLKQSNIATTW